MLPLPQNIPGVTSVCFEGGGSQFICRTVYFESAKYITVYSYVKLAIIIIIPRNFGTSPLPDHFREVLLLIRILKSSASFIVDISNYFFCDVTIDCVSYFRNRLYVRYRSILQSNLSLLYIYLWYEWDIPTFLNHNYAN